MKGVNARNSKGDQIHFKSLEEHLSIFFEGIRFLTSQIKDAYYDEIKPELPVILSQSSMPEEELIDLVTQIAGKYELLSINVLYLLNKVLIKEYISK